MSKKLALKKETLAELTSDQLRAVYGGAGSDSCTSCICSCKENSCNMGGAKDALAALAAFVDADCG